MSDGRVGGDGEAGLVREVVLLIKKGNGSIVPTAPAIVVDAIKIRRIRPATSLPKLLLPEAGGERKTPSRRVSCYLACQRPNGLIDVQ